MVNLIIKKGLTIVTLFIEGTNEYYHIAEGTILKGKLIVIKYENDEFNNIYEIPFSELSISSLDELIKAFQNKPNEYYEKITRERIRIEKVIVKEDE